MITVGTEFMFKGEAEKRVFPDVYVVTEFDELDNTAIIKNLSTDFSFICRPLRDNDIKIVTKKENNMERNLKMTVEQAQKLYKEQPEMRELLLTTFTKEELEGVVLKGWYELGDYINEGWFIDEISSIHQKTVLRANFTKRYFATEKQAKSALAMAQLSQLMKDLGDECNVDWENHNKYVIKRLGDTLTVDYVERNYHFLAFKTAKVRDAFMIKHKRLIKDYFMLD